MESSHHTSPKKLWIGGIAIFTLVTLIDQWMKLQAMELLYPVSWGWIHFYPVQNGGILGGYFADLHPWVIRIFFSVLFGFLSLGGFLLIHFIQHKPVPILKWGIILYIAGMMGNVWDRMTTGKIIDFIIFGISTDEAMAFNFADFVVLAGVIAILISLIKDASVIWHQGEQRRGHWVEPKFQFHLGSLFVLTGLAHFVLIGVYSFTFLKVFVSGEQEMFSLDGDRIIRDYLAGLFIIEGGALLLTFAASILVSHRMVGPLVALEQFIKKWTSSTQPENLVLRRSDYLKEKIETIGRLTVQRLKNQKPLE